MSVEWYYTTNKQQMGPVSWNELRELADAGTLQPNDLVWSDGMDEWVKASQQQGLCAAEERTRVKKKSSVKPAPERRSTRRDDEDEDEDEDDETPKRKKRKHKRADNGSVHIGIKIGLVLAGVFAIFVMCGGCTIGIIWFTLRDGGGARVNHNFTIVNLHQGRWEERRIHLPEGRRLLITVTGNAPFGCDIDLFVLRGNGFGDHFIAADQSIGPHSRLEFVVPASDTYRIRIANLGPGMANSCQVSITER